MEQNKKSASVKMALVYATLILLTFLCLFFFYILIINSTRNHFQIQRGFSFIPGKSFLANLKNVLNDAKNTLNAFISLEDSAKAINSEFSDNDILNKVNTLSSNVSTILKNTNTIIAQTS